MRIAEQDQVAASYPGVPTAAVEHLLWALHRVRPVIEGGDAAAALERLRTDLAGYDGDMQDLARLGVMQLFRGLERGRTQFAGALGAQGLLAPEPTVDGGRPAITRYAVVGPLLDARAWLRQRGIGQNALISLMRETDTYKLRGLDGAGVAIVRLGDRRGVAQIEEALSALLARGAITLSPQWRPGKVADAGEPRLPLRPLAQPGA